MSDALNLADLYDAHAEALFGYALSLTRHEADARDVLQAVFVKLATRRDSLSAIKNERAWLLHVTHGVFVDLVRRRQVRDRVQALFSAEQPTVFFEADDALLAPAECECLSRALDALPVAQRAVVHLKIWERLTFEQIGALLEQPKGTIVSRYQAALRRLKGELRSLCTRTSGEARCGYDFTLNHFHTT